MGCYYCGGNVTGVEHVPPRSFFPRGMRQDLITVDSCDFHNQEKSKEDEYVRAILLSSIKIDEHPHLEELRNTSIRAVERSVKRAFERQPTKEQAEKVLEIIEKYENDPVGGAKAFDEIHSQGIMSLGLMGLVNKDTREETVIDSRGLEVKTTSFVYDRKRLYGFLDCMARGIFYHELGERWKGSVHFLPHTFLKDDASQYDKDLSEDFLKHFDWTAAKGAQKEIFCYEGANRRHPETGKVESIFFTFCFFNTFYFTAVFPL